MGSSSGSAEVQSKPVILWCVDGYRNYSCADNMARSADKDVRKVMRPNGKSNSCYVRKRPVKQPKQSDETSTKVTFLVKTFDKATLEAAVARAGILEEARQEKEDLQQAGDASQASEAAASAVTTANKSTETSTENVKAGVKDSMGGIPIQAAEKEQNSAVPLDEKTGGSAQKLAGEPEKVQAPQPAENEKEKPAKKEEKGKPLEKDAAKSASTQRDKAVQTEVELIAETVVNDGSDARPMREHRRRTENTSGIERTRKRHNMRLSSRGGTRPISPISKRGPIKSPRRFSTDSESESTFTFNDNQGKQGRSRLRDNLHRYQSVRFDDPWTPRTRRESNGEYARKVSRGFGPRMDNDAQLFA